jgi:hypothetical protein
MKSMRERTFELVWPCSRQLACFQLERVGNNGTDKACLVRRLSANLAAESFVEAKAQRQPTNPPVTPIVTPNVVSYAVQPDNLNEWLVSARCSTSHERKY